MADKSAIEKLIERAPLAVIIIGIIVFILGAAGGFPIGNPPLQVTDSAWRIALGAVGLILAGVGLLLLFREAGLPTKSGKEFDKFFLDKWPENDLIEEIKKSKDVLLIGVSLRRTIKSNRDQFLDKLQQGDSIRVLVVDPDSVASEIAANRPRQPDVERTREGIRATLKFLCELVQKTDKTAGKLEIRIVDYPLSVGGIAIDSETDHGALYMEHYTFKMKTPDVDQPKFILRNKDGRWYELFRQQAEMLWKEGVVWRCQDI